MAQTSRQIFQSQNTAYTIVCCMLVGFTVSLPCRAAPAFSPKPAWRTDENGEVFPEVIAKCANGRCWGVLPEAEIPPSDYVITDNEPIFNQIQNVRVRAIEESADSWQDIPDQEEAELRRNTNSQYGNGGKLVKKEATPPRGWVAGGMPFSVLYMSPRIGQAAGSGYMREELSMLEKEPFIQSKKNISQAHPRKMPRNSNAGKLKHRPVPRLFISYGWGPSKK